MTDRRAVVAAIRKAHKHPIHGEPWKPFPLESTPEREQHALQLGRALVDASEEARRADKAARARARAVTDATREKRRADKAARSRAKAIAEAARERQRADEAATEALALKAQREKARAGRAKGAEEARKMKPRRDLEGEIVKRLEKGYTIRRIAKHLKCRPSRVAEIRKKRFP